MPSAGFFSQSCLVAIGHNHLGAFLREEVGDRFTDPVRSRRYERQLSPNSEVHGNLLA